MRSPIEAARLVSGAARSKLRGASDGAGTCNERRNVASRGASDAATGATSAVSPTSHGTTLQRHGKPKPGWPTRIGTGICSGRRSLSVISQRCSFASWRAAVAERGRRGVVDGRSGRRQCLDREADAVRARLPDLPHLRPRSRAVEFTHPRAARLFPLITDQAHRQRASTRRPCLCEATRMIPNALWR